MSASSSLLIYAYLDALSTVLLDSAPLRYLLTRRWDRPSPPIHLQNRILRYTTLRDTKRLATVKRHQCCETRLKIAEIREQARQVAHRTRWMERALEGVGWRIRLVRNPNMLS
ncbi:hypothetical protein DFP72DRAFT_460574 [Ephemerocybe angulata]|uniref:Uncharacterized protein n=1 Tax=Ephemerocybe angulata TaxID=980116 RepID=A0A8H6LU15_9AGAR|nr:hypothetical protein DFP72DRAFT_460574 [Tulosesus angulatus]